MRGTLAFYAAAQGHEEPDDLPVSFGAVDPVTFRTDRSWRREFARGAAALFLFAFCCQVAPCCTARASSAACCISAALGDGVFRIASRARCPPRRPMSTPSIMQAGKAVKTIQYVAVGIDRLTRLEGRRGDSISMGELKREGRRDAGRGVETVAFREKPGQNELFAQNICYR